MDLQYEHVYFYLRRGTSMQIYMSFRHSQRRSRDGGGHFVKYTNIHTIPKPYQNKMSNLDSFSSLVHFSLLHVYLYYRLDTCITGPLPSFSHFFGWEANLFLLPQNSWNSKWPQTSVKVKIRASSALWGCFNVLLLWYCFCSWSLLPSTTSQTRKLWWVLWKK